LQGAFADAAAADDEDEVVEEDELCVVLVVLVLVVVVVVVVTLAATVTSTPLPTPSSPTAGQTSSHFDVVDGFDAIVADVTVVEVTAGDVAIIDDVGGSLPALFTAELPVSTTVCPHSKSTLLCSFRVLKAVVGAANDVTFEHDGGVSFDVMPSRHFFLELASPDFTEPCELAALTQARVELFVCDVTIPCDDALDDVLLHCAWVIWKASRSVSLKTSENGEEEVEEARRMSGGVSGESSAATPPPPPITFPPFSNPSPPPVSKPSPFSWKVLAPKGGAERGEGGRSELSLARR
jgi:hypothetical protein